MTGITLTTAEMVSREYEKGRSEGYKAGAHLSRRERIATAVLASWGEPSWSASEQWQDRQNVVQAAITYADLLIEELDKR